MSNREGKKPKFDPALRPSDRKEPVFDTALIGGAYPHKPLWKFARLDLDGNWGWSQIDKDGLLRVLERLRAFESMTWREIEEKKTKHGPQCHPMEITSVTKEARDRLSEIQLTEAPQLYSLRCTGGERIWGYRLGRVFHIVWWDPDHTVCPVGKRGT